MSQEEGLAVFPFVSDRQHRSNRLLCWSEVSSRELKQRMRDDSKQKKINTREQISRTYTWVSSSLFLAESVSFF